MKMKKLGKYDFIAINQRMNGNWNGGNWQIPFCNNSIETKGTTKGEELEMLRKLQRTTIGSCCNRGKK